MYLKRLQHTIDMTEIYHVNGITQWGLNIKLNQSFFSNHDISKKKITGIALSKNPFLKSKFTILVPGFWEV